MEISPTDPPSQYWCHSRSLIQREATATEKQFSGGRRGSQQCVALTTSSWTTSGATPRSWLDAAQTSGSLSQRDSRTVSSSSWSFFPPSESLSPLRLLLSNKSFPSWLVRRSALPSWESSSLDQMANCLMSRQRDKLYP